jgi:uncharacterized protein YbaR (Trm112 family)
MVAKELGQAIDPRLIDIMECPRCHSELQLDAARLCCMSGHEYPVVNGVPVFLLPEKTQTIGIAKNSYDVAQCDGNGPLYVETLGLSAIERASIEKRWAEKGNGNGNGNGNGIDPAIAYLIGATCGLGYVKLIGKVTTYPIPRIPINEGSGELLLDLGCNWGRWSISAARKGWCVVGIDPSLGAIMAARRAFKNERDVMFVCGDARFLPFRAKTFVRVFSYSVVQHFAEIDATVALAEVGRVLDRNGVSTIQMAHRKGIRSTYIRVRRGYLSGDIFRVRYWSLSQMRRTFTKEIGPSRLIPEAFGGLGLLGEDWKMVSARAKILIFISTTLKAIARIVKPLIYIADSVYVISIKR